jgi:hypothetical protein
MRGVSGLAAACVTAAMQGVCVQLAPAQTAQDGSIDSSFLYFSGADLWRDGAFLHSGLLWSPDALGREGFTLKLMWGGGAYRYRSGALGGAEVAGRELSVAVLPGWRFKHDKIQLTVFAGLDAQEHRLFPDDRGSRLRGNMVGLRGAFDLWYQPSPDMMLAVDASASSIGPDYTARTAVGWRVADSFYAGPEVQVLTCDDYRQFRVGAHVTAFKTDIFEWSGALGEAWDSDHRASLYGRLGFNVRY